MILALFLPNTRKVLLEECASIVDDEGKIGNLASSIIESKKECIEALGATVRKEERHA